MKTIPEDLTVGSIAIVVARFNTLVRRLSPGRWKRCRMRRRGRKDGRRLGTGFLRARLHRPRSCRSGASMVICLGCVIKGETEHNEYINREAARGIAESVSRPACRPSSADHPHNLEQARARARRPRKQGP
jgi:6,7-dimethyl-8-ribityllumazine synthase